MFELHVCVCTRACVPVLCKCKGRLSLFLLKELKLPSYTATKATQKNSLGMGRRLPLGLFPAHLLQAPKYRLCLPAHNLCSLFLQGSGKVDESLDRTKNEGPKAKQGAPKAQPPPGKSKKGKR